MKLVLDFVLMNTILNTEEVQQIAKQLLQRACKKTIDIFRRFIENVFKFYQKNLSIIPGIF